MTDHSTNDHPRKRQADAMARAAAWALVAHQCADHEIDDDAPRQSQEDMIRLLELPGLGDESAMELVLVALGDILDELIGPAEAIRQIRGRFPSRMGDHISIVVAETIAAHGGLSSEGAASMAGKAKEDAEFWGVLGDSVPPRPGN